jgi:hypothetical protein
MEFKIYLFWPEISLFFFSQYDIFLRTLGTSFIYSVFFIHRPLRSSHRARREFLFYFFPSILQKHRRTGGTKKSKPFRRRLSFHLRFASFAAINWRGKPGKFWVTLIFAAFFPYRQQPVALLNHPVPSSSCGLLLHQAIGLYLGTPVGVVTKFHWASLKSGLLP